jgi:protease-4
MTKDEVNAVGRGRVWTGAQARDLKLVDELGGLTKAVEMAKGLAGIAREEEVRLVVWPKKRTFWESLLGRRAPESMLDMRPGLKQAALALRLMERNRVWAVMPFLSGPE